MKTSETKLHLQSLDYDIDEDVSSEPQPHSSTSKMVEKKATPTKPHSSSLSSSSSSNYNVPLSGMVLNEYYFYYSDLCIRQLTGFFSISFFNFQGTTKTPPCATQGRFYCSYKEDYPESIVAEITRYYKWPLEKLFRDLRQQVMPKLANDNYGALVCDSITRVVR